MDESAEAIAGAVSGSGGARSSERVWPMAVVMVNEDTENALKVAAGDDREPIEALSASSADEALGDRVGLRRAYRVLIPRCPRLRRWRRSPC
jgi:hypothetical protein